MNDDGGGARAWLAFFLKMIHGERASRLCCLSLTLNDTLCRYEGAKLERARDLFEQCLAKCPPALAPEFFIKVCCVVLGGSGHTPAAWMQRRRRRQQEEDGLTPALVKQYARLEEDFGLARHAMAIYDRCVWG